jgi:alkylation response protein AidB-like acyl-CoA dehydrogenase
MSSKSAVESFLDRVRELEPLIREHAPKSEELRYMSPVLVDAYKQAGFYAMYRPKTWGGAELDPIGLLRVVEAIARLDAPSAWNVGNASTFDCFLVPLFSEEGAREIAGGSEAVHSGAVHPPGGGFPSTAAIGSRRERRS